MVRSQHDLWSVWGESGMAIVDEPNDPILWASRDVEDELHAATFDLLHGFYRQAVASLRSCLELMLVGCYRTVADAPDGFSFKRIAEKIRAISHVQALDQRLDVSCGRTLFGRENYWRPLVNGWTLERRARQAEAIRRWRPWEHATGPRTVDGKARSGRNADRGGQRPRWRELVKALNAGMRAQREALGVSSPFRARQLVARLDPVSRTDRRLRCSR